MVYANYAALAAVEVEGVDYLRTVQTVTGAKYASVAIHGGGIEPGSGEMAQYVAGTRMSYYEFDGIKSSGNSALHITSTTFDEPLGVALVSAAERCLSFHGFTGTAGVAETAVGGRDPILRDAVSAALTAAGFTVITTPSEIAGSDRDNFCNRVTTGNGVQIEMSLAQRQAFFPGGSTSKATRDSGVREAAFYAYAAAILGVVNDFPNDPLPIVGEMFIDGAWRDVTKDIREDEQIRIANRGTPNEGSSLSTSTCAFKLNNGTSKAPDTAGSFGVYSNRNPLSPWFGLLGQNTPFRVKVADGAVSFVNYPTGTGIGYIQTTDKAVLDITGDIDIRVDADPGYWAPQAADSIILASKYLGTGNQRSWFLSLTQSGLLRFDWTTAGTLATRITSYSTVPLPDRSGRQAVRVTLDVNNGSGGYDVKFYTASSMLGSWTQLGATVTGGSTTSIYSGTALLVVGGLSGGNADSGFDPVPDYLYGKLYGFRMYSGIAGTLVADLDTTSQTPGATSWSDGLGTPNTWTVQGDAGEVATGNRRFTGEIAQMPMEWDGTGNDVYIRTVASDISRRITQGRDDLKSTMYRYVQSDLGSLGGVTGHWPCEDGFNSTVLAAATGTTGAVTDVSFGADAELLSSAGAVALNSSVSVMGAAARVTAAATTQAFTFLMRCVTRPAAQEVLFYVRSTGTIRRWEIMIGPTTQRLRGYLEDGTLSIDDNIGNGSDPDQNWVLWSLYLEQNGGNVDYAIKFLDVVAGDALLQVSGSYAGTVGRFSSWVTGNATNLVDFKFAHIFITRNVDNSDIYTGELLSAALAFAGETAAARLRRLGAQEGVPVQVVGAGRDTETMGPQLPGQLIDLFKECAAVDGGILFTPREFLGYRYRTRRSLLNQQSRYLDYSAGHLTGQLKPTDDDQLLRNDVTISRPGGASARVEKTTGPKSTLQPADGGAGRYATKYDLNTDRDSRLSGLAGLAVHLGTWDEERYPQVQQDLERAVFVASPTLTAVVAALDIGDRLDITGMPDWGRPDDVSALVRGADETLSNRGWRHVQNTSPYGPYVVNDLDPNGNGRRRAAGSNSTTAAGFTSTATSFTVSTPTGKLWGTTAKKPGNFPLNVVVGGERILISGISGTGTTQTFTVATNGRSQNSVVKSHGTGEPVQVVEAFYVTL